MPDINFGLLDTQPRSPQIGTFQTPAAPNTQAFLGGLSQGQQIAASSAQTALSNQELQQRAITNPLDVQTKQQAVASGAIDLTQKQRAESDIVAQRAAASKGWDSYIQTKMSTDPEGALNAINTKTNIEKNLIGKDKDVEDLSFSKAQHAADTMTKSGNAMHDIIGQSMDPRTGQPDDQKVMTAYTAQYPQIKAIDPNNAPDPAKSTPAQIEAYGASSMHLGLDYSLAMKTKYNEMQEAAKQAESSKGAITTDAVKNAQASATSAVPVKQAAQQYQDLLNQVTVDNTPTGPRFNMSLQGKKILAGMGADPNLSIPESLKLASNKLLVSNLKTLKTMPRSSAVIDTIAGANADPTMQLDVQKDAINNILQESNENIVKPDFMSDFKNQNQNDTAGVNTSWQKFLDADPVYQVTGKHSSAWVSNPDNYKPFLDRDYKAPKATLDDVASELLKRGVK